MQIDNQTPLFELTVSAKNIREIDEENQRVTLMFNSSEAALIVEAIIGQIDEPNLLEQIEREVEADSNKEEE